MGGELFQGSALDKAGLVQKGKVALIGPVAITAKSGKVKGTFLNGLVKTTEEGVLLQDANVGRGFYLGTSESGAMTLTPK